MAFGKLAALHDGRDGHSALLLDPLGLVVDASPPRRHQLPRARSGLPPALLDVARVRIVTQEVAERHGAGEQREDAQVEKEVEPPRECPA